MAKHERQKHGAQQQEESVATEESTVGTAKKAQANQDAGDAALQRMAGGKSRAPRGDVEDVGVDEMLMFQVDAPEVARMKAKLVHQITEADQAGVRALNFFQSVLRQEKAKAVLGKDFLREKFENNAVGFVKDKLVAGAGAIFSTSPVGAAVMVVAEGKDAVDGYVEKNQTRAETEIVDRLVGSMTKRIFNMCRVATDRLDKMDEYQLIQTYQTTDTDRPLIDDAALAKQLIMMFDEQMRESGTMSVAEQIDQIQGRRNTGEEIEAAQRRQAETK